MASTSSIPACLTATAPVLGHPGLESDVTLSTEVLPGPPPLLSVQQSFQKRDLKKPVYSYVPSTDPGTSYCGSVHGTTSHPDPASDQASSGRGQRASARNHQSAAVAPSLPPPSTNPSTMNSSRPLESLVPAFGKSTSRTIILPPLQHPAPAPPGGRTRRRDKGKARETDRVKDEAVTIDSPSPVESLDRASDEICFSCSQPFGQIIFCDGCPKSFHLLCLDPPMAEDEIPADKWFCPCCVIHKHPPRKPPPSLMAPLLHHLETSPPQVFELPLDIREHFKDIGTSAKGTYVDTSDVKHYRPNKYGLVEPRDPHRLRDRDGSPILCFRCGLSAVPPNMTAGPSRRSRRAAAQSGPAPDDVWKNMISCDYCDLHWHLDCLDPPRLTMPSASKKFMCPNHAEKVKPIKLRIPKLNAPPIDIKKAGLYNNGNIDIVQPIIPPSSETGALDDTVKYGRKFRVPEKVVLLDFWAKVSGPDRSTSPDEESSDDSALSSPLTSLSSLDDNEMTAVPGRTPDDLELAGLLCGFAGVYMHSNGTSVPPSTRSPSAPIFEQSSSSTSVSSGDHVASGSSYQGETPRGTRSKSPVKLEEDDRTLPDSSNGSASQIPAFSRATSPSVAMATAEGSASSSNRKRKIREDDPSEHSDHGRPSAIEHANVSTRLPSGVRTPRKASRPVSGVKSSPGTPSLKIRLPALNHLNNTGSSSSRNAALPTTLALNSGSISTG